MMTWKHAFELRRDAWNALATNSQYWWYLLGGFVLAMITAAIIVPLFFVTLIPIVMLVGAASNPTAGGQALSASEVFQDPMMCASILVAAVILSVCLVYPIGFATWGQRTMAIASMRRGLTFNHAFSGWGHGWHMGWIMTVMWTYELLWSLLLIVPGIIKCFSYAMTPFLAVDHPTWTAKQCIGESERLMAGNKWRLFCLLISFIGWWCLAVATSLIPFVGNFSNFLLAPYVDTAVAAFYEELLDHDEGVPAES